MQVSRIEPMKLHHVIHMQFSLMKLSIHGHCKQHPYVRIKISRIKQLRTRNGDTGDLQKKGFQKRLQLQLLQVQGYTAYYQPRPENRVEERTLGSVTRSGLSSAVKRLQAMKEYLPLGQMKPRKAIEALHNITREGVQVPKPSNTQSTIAISYVYNGLIPDQGSWVRQHEAGMRTTEFLPNEKEEDKHPLRTLLETVRLEEIIDTDKISQCLTKVFDLYLFHLFQEKKNPNVECLAIYRYLLYILLYKDSLFSFVQIKKSGRQ